MSIPSKWIQQLDNTFFFYDVYLKMTKIINLVGLSLRVFIEFVDETTSQLS